MGKLLLCTGQIAKRPYILPFSRTMVYSMEELNYALYHNIYMVSEETFDITLCDWIDQELGLPEVANKIKALLNRRNNVKDIIVSLLCSAEYYTEPEIRELIKIMDQIERMPFIKKRKIKADNYLAYGQYAKAAYEYEAIVDSVESAIFTGEEYGDIYHNLAVTKAKTVSASEASKYFLLAYRRNQREETLNQYLYSLMLSKNTSELEAACAEFNISKERQEQLEEAIFEKELAALEIDDYVEINNLSELKKQGKVASYYKELKQLIRQYKDAYRKGTIS